jgi:large subunit ribosomal protein L25
MEQVTLRAEPGRAIGSRESRRLRRSGLVPAVVYGRGLTPISVAVSRTDLYGALHTEAGLNAVINLEVDGDVYTTVAREIDRDPTRGEVIHLDFLQISLDEEIQAEVAVEFTGEAAGVREGGIVETIRNSVVVDALPTSVPSSIPLDISELTIGQSLTIADLPAIDGVTYVDDPDTTLVIVGAPSIEPIEAEPEGEEEGAEFEGEEGAEAAESEEEDEA